MLLSPFIIHFLRTLFVYGKCTHFLCISKMILHKLQNIVVACSPIPRDFLALDAMILNHQALLAVLVNGNRLQ